MPPEIEAPPPPTDRHMSAVTWLEYHGINARTQPIRSSDFGVISTSPFDYYLTRRLGLADPLKWSQVLNRGTWFHKRLECLPATSSTAKDFMDAALADRKKELTTVCSSRGVLGVGLDRVLAREEKDAYEALAWFDSAVGSADEPGIIVPQSKWLEKGAWAFFNDPVRQLLGTEVKLAYTPPGRSWKVPIVIQIDRLYYNTRTNKVWILDAKSTGKSAQVRATVCPHEFQRQLYSWVVTELMKTGDLQRHYNIPTSATFGGMIHLIVQCGSIEFGEKDRPYKEEPHTLTRGPRKGQIEMRREYIGDTPSWDNFRKRAREWHRGEGEYVDKAGERANAPCIELSFTGPLTPEEHEEFWSKLMIVKEYAEKPAYPAGFFRTSTGMAPYSELSDVSLFYVTEPVMWPELIKQKGFIQVFRDEEGLTDSLILSNPKVDEVSDNGN